MVVDVIRDGGSVFRTVCFAIVYNGYQTEYFVLNEAGKFERVFGMKQNTKRIINQVMVVDIHKFDDGDWLKEKKCEGYKQFIHNPQLLDRIRNGESDAFDWLTQSSWDSLQGNFSDKVDYGPIEIDDQNDIDNFMAFTGWCHDGVVRKVDWNNDKSEVTLTLEGVWGLKHLFLTFKLDIDLYLAEDYLYDYLFGCSLFFENGKICFAGEEDVDSISSADSITHVSAKRMYYSFEYGESDDDIRGGPEML